MTPENTGSDIYDPGKEGTCISLPVNTDKTTLCKFIFVISFSQQNNKKINYIKNPY